MGRIDRNDFRDAAAAESARRVPRPDSADVLDSASSLCLRMEGDPTGAFYRIALVPAIWLSLSLGLLLTGPVLGVLILTPVLDAHWWSVLLAVACFVAGVVLSLMLPGAVDGVFEGALEARLGRRLDDLKFRVTELRRCCVEDPATYDKRKFVSEDYAFGGLDLRRPGLLLEGLRYRYVIRPDDATETRQDEDYLLVTFRVGGATVTLALALLTHDDKAEAAKARKEIQERLGTNPRLT